MNCTNKKEIVFDCIDSSSRNSICERYRAKGKFFKVKQTFYSKKNEVYEYFSESGIVA